MLTALRSPDYWIIPIALLGAVIGSFLNVVIFRLPRGMSIGNPRWSMCPHCGNRIRPRHNLPVLSWLCLRGRCRDCGKPIVGVYPLIECATAFLFVMIWDALFIAQMIPGIEQPAADWPIAAAFLVLFAVLLATSAMDVESYIIDIRLCIVAMVAGVFCHGVRGMPDAVLVAPREFRGGAAAASAIEAVGRLPAAVCIACLAMGLAWCLTALIASHWFTGGLGRGEARKHDADEDPSELAGDDADEQPTAYLNEAGTVFRPAPIICFVLVIVGMVCWLLLSPEWPSRLGELPRPGAGLRGLIACGAFMFILTAVSLVPREADRLIVEEIDAESDRARATAFGELAGFFPALLVGLGIWLYLRSGGRTQASFAELLGMAPSGSVWIGHLHSACQAAAAMILAAALGWTVRLLGTVAFGKEAFGTGDIYIMSAMAAVVGFWAVLFTFFLAALLALIGVLATVFRKSSRAVPFGPWLALGAFVNLWLYGGLLEFFSPAGRLLWSLISGRSFTG